MTYRVDISDRIGSAIAAGMLVALLGYALLAGLSINVRRQVAAGLAVFDAPPAPPPPVEKVAPRRAADPRRNGAAAPPNLTAKATEIVAPPPTLPVTTPPPVVVATVAGAGADRSAGAAPIIGPGTGSGGQGNGTGSGTGGDGEGAGGGGEIPLRLIHGRLRYADLPRALYDDNVAGTVDMRFVVGAKGRVTACRVTHSSGNVALDTATCRLVVDKLRYLPTRDAAGHAVADTVMGQQIWDTVERGED